MIQIADGRGRIFRQIVRRTDLAVEISSGLQPQSSAELVAQHEIELPQLMLDEVVRQIARLRRPARLGIRRQQQPVVDVPVENELIGGTAEILRADGLGPVGGGHE